MLLSATAERDSGDNGDVQRGGQPRNVHTEADQQRFSRHQGEISGRLDRLCAAILITNITLYIYLNTPKKVNYIQVFPNVNYIPVQRVVHGIAW